MALDSQSSPWLTTRTQRRLAVALLVLAPVAGCKDKSKATTGAAKVAPAGKGAEKIKPCSAASQAIVELRSQDGTLQLSLRKAPSGEQVVCDGAEKLIGKMVATASSLVLKDPAGQEIASAAENEGADSMLTVGGKGYRLHDSSRLLRLIDPQGVPLGQLGEQGNRAIAFNPGGRPLATAEPARDGDDRRAIRSPDGTVTHLVMGLSANRAAAAFALEGLEPPVALLLARFMDTRPDAAAAAPPAAANAAPAAPKKAAQ